MKDFFRVMVHVSTLALLLSFLGSPDNRGANTSSQLTVTAVVTSSVSITIAPDGRQLSVANAPADEAALVAAATRKIPVFVHKKERQQHIRNASHKCQEKFVSSPE